MHGYHGLCKDHGHVGCGHSCSGGGGLLLSRAGVVLVMMNRTKNKNLQEAGITLLHRHLCHSCGQCVGHD
jgi:hypothetical protein